MSSICIIKRISRNIVFYEEQFQCHREAWEQFQRLQLFHENCVKELANERAAIASRAAAVEAVNETVTKKDGLR